MSTRHIPQLRRLAAFGAALAVGMTGLVSQAPAAHADDSSTLTIVGTSDVYDSNLVNAVIKPGFQAAYPGVTLNYISKGTGDAIGYAEAGTASALIVHAASLENQFVDGGFSLEQYGRAIFYGDYVLLGYSNDPATIKANDPNDIADAFERIANRGATTGDANFVSRGGKPGTTVQEHAIWGLLADRTEPNFTLCKVSDANGGGYMPTTNATQSGDCASSPTYPSWYHVTGANQGDNLRNAETCNYTGGGCYVFTDRGTYQYLDSNDGGNQVNDLSIVTRDNSADAPGGSTELVNSFHAYGVNPDAFTDPNVKAGINTTAAREFLDWITSPDVQTEIGNYLNNPPDGAPFLPDAAPQISTSAFPASVPAGKPLTVTGNVRNIVPGTPTLDGVTVRLRSALPGSAAFATVDSTTTDSTGDYTLSFVPNQRRIYSVATPQLSKIENATLNPQFGDILVANTTPASAPVDVLGSLVLHNLHAGKGFVAGTADFAPPVRGDGAKLQLYGRRTSSSLTSLRLIAQAPLSPNSTTKNFSFPLNAGGWRLQLRYVNTGVITAGASKIHTLTVS